MEPALLQLIIFGVQQAIKLEPALAAEFKTIFASGNPTDADFDAARDRVASDSYRKFVPQTQLTQAEAP